jgi:hypothetical protein
MGEGTDEREKQKKIKTCLLSFRRDRIQSCRGSGWKPIDSFPAIAAGDFPVVLFLTRGSGSGFTCEFCFCSDLLLFCWLVTPARRCTVACGYYTSVFRASTSLLPYGVFTFSGDVSAIRIANDSAAQLENLW